MKNILNQDETTQIDTTPPIHWLIGAANKDFENKSYIAALAKYEKILAHQDFNKLDSAFKFKVYGFYGIACAWNGKQHATLNFNTKSSEEIECYLKARALLVKALENYSPECAELIEYSTYSQIIQELLQIYNILQNWYFEYDDNAHVLEVIQNRISDIHSLNEKNPTQEFRTLVMQLYKLQQKVKYFVNKAQQAIKNVSSFLKNPQRKRGRPPKSDKQHKKTKLYPVNKALFLDLEIKDKIHKNIRVAIENFYKDNSRPIVIQAYEKTHEALTITLDYLLSLFLRGCTAKNVNLNEETFSIEISEGTVETFVKNFEKFSNKAESTKVSHKTLTKIVDEKTSNPVTMSTTPITRTFWWKENFFSHTLAFPNVVDVLVPNPVLAHKAIEPPTTQQTETPSDSTLEIPRRKF